VEKASRSATQQVMMMTKLIVVENIAFVVGISVVAKNSAKMKMVGLEVKKCVATMMREIGGIVNVVTQA